MSEVLEYRESMMQGVSKKISGAPTLTKIKIDGIICHCKRRPYLHPYSWKCHMWALYEKYYVYSNKRLTRTIRLEIFANDTERAKLIKQLLLKKESALRVNNISEAKKLRRRLRTLNYKSYLKEVRIHQRSS